MNELLRPSTLGEILDRTANLYRSRFLVFFGIASVPAGVVLGFAGLVVLLFAWSETAGPSVAIAVGLGALALCVLGLPLMIASNALSGAALCHAANALLFGETITIATAYKAVWRRGWHYVGLYLLLLLIVAVAPATVWMVLVGSVDLAVLASGGRPGTAVSAFFVLLLIALALYAAWILLRLCLAFPAAVAEQARVGAALKRASRLSRGTRWRMLVLFVLGVALSWVGSLLLMVPLTVVLALVPAMNSPQHAQMLGTVVLIGFYGASFVVQALTMPVYAIALVLFYYDQRVRQEGFDIELLMRQAGMAAEAIPAMEAAPWMPAAARPEQAGAEAAANAEDKGPEETQGSAGGAK